MTYNCGGLSSGTYQEILVWLKQEAEQGRPIDIACVQETAWREDFEFRTSMDSQQDTVVCSALGRPKQDGSALSHKDLIAAC